MKIRYPIAVLLLLFLGMESVNAQIRVPLIADMDTVVVEFQALEDDEVYKQNFVTSDTTDTISVRWFFDLSDASLWEVAVCDKNLCYAPGTDDVTYRLAPGERGEFSVHLYPKEDNSVKEAYVLGKQVLNGEENSDTMYILNHFINTDFVSSVGENSAEKSSVYIYPNPALGDQLHVYSDTQLGRVSLSTITGRKILDHRVNDKLYDMDISSLPNGVYFLRVFDTENRLIVTNKVLRR